MTRFTIELAPATMDRLRDVALEERRSVRDQARLFVERQIAQEWQRRKRRQTKGEEVGHATA